SNTTTEPEFYRALPEDVTLHTARLYLTQIAADSIQGMVGDIENQSRLLATANVDVIVLSATAPSLLKGLGYDREIIARIEKAAVKPSTTAATAMVDAMRHLGLQKVVLGAAYDDKVNAIARSFLKANEFNVLEAHGLGYVDNLQVGLLSAETAYDLAKK